MKTIIANKAVMKMHWGYPAFFLAMGVLFFIAGIVAVMSNGRGVAPPCMLAFSGVFLVFGMLLAWPEKKEAK